MLERPLLVALPIGLLLTVVSCSGDAAKISRASRDPRVGGPAATTDTDDSAAAPSGEGTSRSEKDLCATLDYGHERPNEDYFLRFADDAAAMAYSKDFLEANDIDDPAEMTRDPRTMRLVGRVFEGFRKVFPNETAGMTAPPRTIAVKAGGVNAFAGYDERKEYEKAPWIFWVHQATIDSQKPDAELAALYAHELAHLILRNMLPETRSKIRTHYRVPGGKEKGVIGQVAQDEEAARAHASELRTIGDLVGREPVFGPIPMSAYEDSEYQSMLKTLAGDRQRSEDPRACQAADTGLARVKELYRQNVSVHDLTLVLPERTRQELAALTETTRDSLRRCYGTVKKSLLELKIEDKSVRVLVNGEPAPRERLLDPTTQEHALVYSALMTNDVERDVDRRTDLTTIDRVLEVVDKLHRRAAELEADTSLPIDELRVFDLEEDADDAAVRVLRAIGDDPRGATNLFLGQLPDPAACTRQIEGGIVPRYGRFIDPHNATCWRAFHASDLAEALERCPSVPTPQAAPRRAASGAVPDGLRLTQRRRLGVRR